MKTLLSPFKRLSTYLVLASLCLTAYGYHYIQLSKEQSLACERVLQGGGQFFYSYQLNHDCEITKKRKNKYNSQWVRWLGNDLLYPVHRTDNSVPWMAKPIENGFPNLRFAKNTQMETKRLAELRNLEKIENISGYLFPFRFHRNLKSITFKNSYNESSSLHGLVKLPKLKFLTASAGSTSHLEPLAGCRSLEELTINNRYGDQVQRLDLKVLTKVPTLQKVILDCQQFPDLDDLSEHKNLKEIEITTNDFDPRVSHEIPAMTSLSIDTNYFVNLNSIRFFPNLKKLKLNQSTVYSASAIGNLTKLEYLRLPEDFPSDFNLKKLKNLNFLSLSDLNQLNLTDLPHPNKLKYLQIGKAEKVCFRNLTKESNLERLFLNHCKEISGVPAIMPKLKDSIHYKSSFQQLPAGDSLTLLSLQDCMVKNAESLKLAKNLKCVAISGGSFPDFEVFQGLRKLSEVDVNSKALKDLSVFASAENLSRLSLETSSVEDLSSLPACQNIRLLNLSSTPFKSFHQLQRFTGLEHLYLADLTNPVDLKPISRLPNLEDLDLSGSPLNSLDHLTNCKTLKRVTLSPNRRTKIDFKQFDQLENPPAFKIHFKQIILRKGDFFYEIWHAFSEKDDDLEDDFFEESEPIVIVPAFIRKLQKKAANYPGLEIKFVGFPPKKRTAEKL